MGQTARVAKSVKRLRKTILSQRMGPFALIFGCSSMLLVAYSLFSRLLLRSAFPLPSAEKFQASDLEKVRNDRAQSFLLVFMGHSGSTAIMTALKQHSEMFISSLEPLDHGMSTGKALRFADFFFNQTRSKGKTGGFKIRPRHLLAAPKKWAGLMKRHNTRLVWNFRRNLMKQAIGHYPIIHFGSRQAYEGLKVESRSTEEEDRHETAVARFSVQIPLLFRLLQKRIDGEGQVVLALQSLKSIRNTSYAPPLLKVSYEDLLADERGTVAQVQEFLGLSMAEQHLPLRRKATSDNLCELLENHDEVCRRFSECSGISWMLNDGACNCSSVDSFASPDCPDLKALGGKINDSAIIS